MRCREVIDIRNIFSYLGLAAAAAYYLSPALLAQEPVAPGAEVRLRVFPFELRSSAPDEEALEVARAADVNLFMDSSDLPDKSSAVPTRFPGKHDWYLENLLIDIGLGRRIAWEIRQEDRALLLAAEPNLKELRQKMLEGPGIDVAVPKLDEATFSTRLADYLQREQGWKGDGTGWSKAIPIADLPEDLKHEMLVRAQQGALNESLGGASLLRKMLRDETWQQARVQIGSQTAVAGPDRAALFLMFKTPTSAITQLLTPLPQPRPEERR